MMISDMHLLAALPLHQLTPLERRVIRNLAGSLCVAMHIQPGGRDLVSLLGHGHEPSNQAALEHWVYCELVKHQLTPDAASLPHLIKHLELIQMNWEYGT